MRRLPLPLLLLLSFGCGNAGTEDLEDPPAGAVDNIPRLTCEMIQNQSTCLDKGTCTWDVCRRCDGVEIFSSCNGAGFVASCPETHCPPAPEECDDLDEIACAENPGCHRVYDGDAPVLCDCDAPGCCTVFSFCAPSHKANCSDANLACRRQSPFCEGPYVISYTGSCYEGCVLADDCAP